MSADNWAVCPRCEKRRQAAIALQQAKLDAAYGTVPLVEFNELRAQIEALEAVRPEQTFREDYEFSGVETGELSIDYSGSCQKCGLRKIIRQVHRLDLSE